MRVPDSATDNLKKLPGWVKCKYCHGGPLADNWLIEIEKGSNNLAHMSCAVAHGKMPGFNIGTIQLVGDKIKAAE